MCKQTKIIGDGSKSHLAWHIFYVNFAMIANFLQSLRQ